MMSKGAKVDLTGRVGANRSISLGRVAVWMNG